jgi:hypothetical protein
LEVNGFQGDSHGSNNTTMVVVTILTPVILYGVDIRGIAESTGIDTSFYSIPRYP